MKLKPRPRALSPPEVRARCDSPVFRGGALIPDFATVQPARLALGLRRRLIERGALVFEGSRVRALRGATAQTANGEVRAGAAVLAVGPAARALRELRARGKTVVCVHHDLPTLDLEHDCGAVGCPDGELA